MIRATPAMRAFAARVIACEAKQNRASPTALPTSFYVVEELRPHLATLMGNGGFRALLLRSLALANVEAPWLRTVQLNADGSMRGWDEADRLDPQELLDGGMVLIAHLLGLLVAFIGENLTERLVREVWANLTPEDVVVSKGAKK